VSVIRHILPLSGNVILFFDVSISCHMKQLHCWELISFAVGVRLGMWVVVRVCTRWVGLRVTAKEMII